MFDLRSSGDSPTHPNKDLEARVQAAVRTGRLQIRVANHDRRNPKDIQEEISEYLTLQSKGELRKVEGWQYQLESFPASLEVFKRALTTCGFRTHQVNLEELQQHSTAFLSAHFRPAAQSCVALCNHSRESLEPAPFNRENASKSIQEAYWLLRDAIAYFEKPPRTIVPHLQLTEDETDQERTEALSKALSFPVMTIIAVDALTALSALNVPSANHFILSLDHSQDPYFEEHSRAGLGRALSSLSSRIETHGPALTRLMEMTRSENTSFVKAIFLECLFEHSNDPAIRAAIIESSGRSWHKLETVMDLIAREFPRDEIPVQLKSTVRYYSWAPLEELEALLVDPNEALLLRDRLKRLKHLLDQKESGHPPFSGTYGEFTARPISFHEQRNCADLFRMDHFFGSLGWSPWLNTRIALCSPNGDSPAGVVLLDEVSSSHTSPTWEISRIARRTGTPLQLQPAIITAGLAAALDLATFHQDPRPLLYPTSLWQLYYSGHTDRIAGMPIEQFITQVGPS